MKVKRVSKVETNEFMVGDIIKFKLADGEKVEAMAVMPEDDGMVFLLVDCLQKEYRMNTRDTNEGGYEQSDLRGKLNGEILAGFPAKIKDKLIAFENGDFLRLPTEKEIFGENPFGEDEPESVEQFKAMEKRRNRIAFQGKNGAWEWYWLQNTVKDSASNFAVVTNGGNATYSYASNSRGVRPAFKI